MSFSLFDEENCYSDLLCDEDSGSFGNDDDDDVNSSRCEIDLELLEEVITGFVEIEGEYVPRSEYSSMLSAVDSIDAASAREFAIDWMIKVHSFYSFQPSTVYLSVNYMDRFLSARCLPETNGWPLQLLSVACLSLAAKIEELLVPSLLDIQAESVKFIFQPRTVCRMEILVLTTLDWKLRSVTPFHFIDFFASKADSTGGFVGYLVTRATQIMLVIVRETKFLEYWPSSVAAAVIYYGAKEIPSLSYINFGNVVSWCNGLNQDQIVGCYKLLQGIVANAYETKPPKVLPQLRVMARTVVSSSDSSSSSSSSSNKRRKLE
ncbi:hypothetical protein GIB67_000548 [Kingdonia uniflora]|uniref:Cyclin N-terminal domain-containing protein n=1 Tax=Kingdonia uniflora TaxID=39325 RepID=A0A7J7MIQ7_9MAGN|nr:hypothetical protein GIB67_000548 [Kingdonia uniflora]